MNGVRGDLLLRLDKKGPGLLLLVMAAGFLVAGIVLPLLHGQWWALALIGISPFLVWMARSLLNEQLAVTTEGVFHVSGRGFAQRPEVRDEASWERIQGVDLEVKRSRSGSSSSTSYTLVFDRGGDGPLRYLVGIPSSSRLVALRRICQERGIRVSL